MEPNFYENLFSDKDKDKKELIKQMNRLLDESLDNFILLRQNQAKEKINIEERLDLIFIFVKGEHIDYSLKIESEHIEKLYKLFKPKKFKKEMERLLNSLSRNLIYIENETIKSFYNDILLNPSLTAIIEIAVIIMLLTLPANPSTPSVKLTAFVLPSITKIVNGIYIHIGKFRL